MTRMELKVFFQVLGRDHAHARMTDGLLCNFVCERVYLLADMSLYHSNKIIHV